MKRVRVSLGVLLAVGVLAGAVLAGGLTPAFYPAGDRMVAILTNEVGAPVTGLHIEFDREVTIVNKIEFGGYLPALTPLSGTSFDFNGGSLVAGGDVELDWQPMDAVPTLILWMDGARAVGAPYVTSVEKLGWLLGVGIIYLRESNPALLAAAFQEFFALNAEFFGQVSLTLGMNIADAVTPVIMTAPAEGIQNFFNTLVGMLGVTSLDELMTGSVNMSPLLKLLGL